MREWFYYVVGECGVEKVAEEGLSSNPVPDGKA